MLVVHMVSFPVLVVPTSHLVVLFTAYISPGHILVLFLVHLVVYLGLGSPLVLCTRNFIATPNLKKRSNDTLSLTRLSACLHLTWSSTEPGIFGAVGFCDSNHCAPVPNKTPCTVKQLFSHQKLIGLRLRPCVHAPAAMCKFGTTNGEGYIFRTTK